LQEQQAQIIGQKQQVHLPPTVIGQKTQAVQQSTVEELQAVVVIPSEGTLVGPITLAFPGYALLLRFAGRNGGMSYTSSVGLIFHS
jgi:hypothetical protein